ncbi:hypothetical protein yaldo0001_14590 [Yersinia aldovae ATCC 35236]|nr:hypothetical protein yaldo0001_14590 [Yersinia aldovae ATCC 35236]
MYGAYYKVLNASKCTFERKVGSVFHQGETKMNNYITNEYVARDEEIWQTLLRWLIR